jgi:hypothetical protein
MGRRTTLATVALAATLLTSCLAPSNGGQVNEGQIFEACADSEIFLLPHHMLVQEYIEEMYKSMPADTQKIIVISPNHFGTGQFTVMPVDEEELGYTPHRDFAKQYFPDAEIEGWMIRVDAQEPELLWLTEKLAAEAQNENSIFIFSVDFSHYLPAEISLVHDLRSIDIIESRSIAAAASVEADSPLAVELMLRLLEARDLSMDVLKNTNPALDTNSPASFENTTHIFACSQDAEPFPRQLNTTMYFAEPQEFYLGLTEEDRYLYGYDETFFSQGGTDTAHVKYLGDQSSGGQSSSEPYEEIYSLNYFE